MAPNMVVVTDGLLCLLTIQVVEQWEGFTAVTSVLPKNVFVCSHEAWKCSVLKLIHPREPLKKKKCFPNLPVQRNPIGVNGLCVS